MGFLLDSYRFVVTASGNVTTAEDNAMTVGGISSAWVAISSVNEWDGTNWTAGTVLPSTLTNAQSMFRGNTDSGINCGGWTGTSLNALVNTQVWNGTAWSNVDDLNTARAIGFAMGGSEDSAFCNGGQSASGGTQIFSSEEYDGSADTWTTKTSSTFGGQGTQGDGTPDDFIKSGGKQDDGGGSYSNNIKVETWNGTSWTTLGVGSNFPLSSAYNYGTCCGVGNDSYMMGTNSSSTGDNLIYKFDGSSWTNSGSATTAPKYVGMGGSSDYAIICGVWQAGTASSVYNGSSWSTTNALQTTRSNSGVGATTAS